jgi:hypothetical protein
MRVRLRVPSPADNMRGPGHHYWLAKVLGITLFLGVSLNNDSVIGNATKVDQDISASAAFQLLREELQEETSIPVLLPRNPPVLPDWGYYGLTTRGVSYGRRPTVTPSEYVVVMRMVDEPIRPNDFKLETGYPQIYYLGYLSGSNAQEDIGTTKCRRLADTVESRSMEVEEHDGRIVYRSDALGGTVGVTWASPNWEYCAISDPSSGAHLEADAAQLADYLQYGPPVAGAERGWVEFYQAGRNWTTVAWKTFDGICYEVQWQNDLHTAIDIVRDLVNISD